METTSLLKTNSSWRRSFYDNLCCTRSANFVTSFRSFAAKYDKFAPSSRFSCFKVQSFKKSISNLTNKINPAVPFNLDDAQFRNSGEKSVIDTIYESFMHLKIPAVLIWQSFLLAMMMCGRNSALARSIAEQNVSVVTSETVGSQSSRNCGRSGAKGDANLTKNEELEQKMHKLINLLLLLMLLEIAIIAYKMNQFGVIKLQVALSYASLMELTVDAIAAKADTSTSESRMDILNRVSQKLHFQGRLNHGYSSVKMFSKKEDAEKYFKHLLRNERGKFDVQVINLNNVEKERIRKRLNGKVENAVLTVLVIAKGIPNFPNNITHLTQLYKAIDQLERLSPFGNAEIHAVNLLWTPQIGQEVLSMKEIVQEYPLLKRLNPNHTLWP